MAMNSGVNGPIESRADEAPVTEHPLPWQLKAVAFLFIVAGTHAAFSMVAGLFHDSLYLRLEVFCLPLGIGLLRSKEGSRSCAGSLLLVGLIGAGLGTVVLALVRQGGYFGPREAPLASVPWYVSLSLMAGVFLLFLWMMRTLDRRDVREAFRSGKRSPGYSRRTKLIVCVAILTGLAVGCVGEYVLWRANPEAISFYGAGKDGGHVVSYAFVFDRLSYVVFQNAPYGETITSAVTGSHHKKWLTKPDGTKFRLPGEHRLYEFKDGALITNDRRVTREEFEAFMASNPDEYTLDALLEFLAESGSDARPN